MSRRRMVAIECDSEATFAKVVAQAGWTTLVNTACDSTWIQIRINPDTGVLWTKQDMLADQRWPWAQGDGPEGWKFNTTALSTYPVLTNADVDDIKVNTIDLFGKLWPFYRNIPGVTHYDPDNGIVFRQGVRLIEVWSPGTMVNTPGIPDGQGGWTTDPIYYQTWLYDLEITDPAFEQGIVGLFKETLGQINNIVSRESRRRDQGLMIDYWGWSPNGEGIPPWATVKLIPGDIDDDVDVPDLQRNIW